MKKLSEESAASIETAICEALVPYREGEEGQEVLTDFYLHVNGDAGELEILDDDDRVLAQLSVPEWTGLPAKEPERECKRELGRILRRIREQGVLENLCILRPYSFVLVDDRRETLAELMLVDDDTLAFDGDLLTGLDEELDRFLEDLMKE